METIVLGGPHALQQTTKTVEIGGGRSKVICSVTGADAAALAGNLRAIDYTVVDLVEWRVDTLANFDDAIIQGVSRVVRRESPVPILATFRTVAQGGTGDSATYARVVNTLLNTGVDAVDIEYTHPQSKTLLETATIRGVAVICSHHELHSTGKIEDIIAELTQMQNYVRNVVAQTRSQLAEDDPTHLGWGSLKYVSQAANPMDALKLMLAVRHFVDVYAEIPVIALSMGEAGQVTRVFPSTAGSAATYASVKGVATAAGQIDHGVFAHFPEGL